jgi:hypothetical protein
MMMTDIEVKQRPRSLGATLRAATAGVVIFVVLLLVDQFSTYYGLTTLQRFGDDLLGGIIVGLISFLVERRRSRYLANQLQVIRLMNHHVRNALQVIKFAHHTEQQVRIIDDAVARIEWALREVLSGKTARADKASFGRNLSGLVG